MKGKPSAPDDLVERATHWPHLSRHERRELARDYRRLGWTYSEIAEVLPVSRGSLSSWVGDIQLAPLQVDSISTRTSQASVSRDTQWRRRLAIQEIRSAAEAAAPALMRHPLWIAGTSLYWAEGDKTTRQLSMTNTDAHMLRLFMSWATRYLDPNPEFVLALHIHDINDEEEARTRWREELEMPDARFTKSYVKASGSGHRKNRLPHGVCRVRMSRSADAFETTMAWIEVLPRLITEQCPESSW